MSNTTPSLLIKEVTVYVRHTQDPELEGIRKIDLDGTEDIFDHREVVRLIQKGGKITGVGGEFYYKDRKYKFKVGYTEDMRDVNNGKVTVEKIGKAEVSIEELEEIYGILLNLFERYFIL